MSKIKNRISKIKMKKEIETFRKFWISLKISKIKKKNRNNG